MNARNLGFTSSWHMLTRDKGWIKPILVLTLVGWIPILGQIALLGYGLEWARLTAWGVDSAPKQRGVDYGKVLSTGGRAFLVNLSIGFVAALVLQVVFPGTLAWMISALCGMGFITATVNVATGMSMTLVVAVLSLFVGTFLHAAMLRATLYDSFGAGWRLDRLFQMIGRDFGGFCKAWLVMFIGSIICGVYAFIVGIIGAIVMAVGLFGATAFVGMSGAHMGYDEMLFHQLLNWGAGPVLLFVIAAVVLLFVGNVIGTAMNLVGMNAMGQWFCRFDVNRWGVSEDPLPADVPHREGAAAPSTGTAPVEPSSAPTSAPANQPMSPEVPAAPADPSDASASPDGFPLEPPTEVKPDEVKTEPPASPEPPAAHEDEAASTVEGACPEMPMVDEEVAREAAEAAVLSVTAEEAASESAEARETVEADREPIPLGPISPDDEDKFSEGPIDA